MMKNNFTPLYMALLACMGLSGLTACSSSDDAGQEPAVNPGEAVKTSFTLSVGTPSGRANAAKPFTRVSNEIAQVNGNFRGIDNITLIPFSGAVTAGSETRLGGSNITLPSVVNNSFTSEQGVSSSNAQARVYNDVTIPLNTSHFLFYGKAIDDNINPQSSISNLTGANAFTTGTLTVSEEDLKDANLDKITFTPKVIYQQEASKTAVATKLAGYLTSIANTSYTYTADGSSTPTTSTWAEYATANTNKPLGQLYTKLTSLTAGSSVSVQATVQDLFESLQNLKEGDGGNNLNASEAALKTAIINNITATGYAQASGNTLSFDNTLNGYPTDYFLPEGSATLTFASNTFTENEEGTNLTNGTQVASLSSFVYPANLWYFGNTDAVTSDASLTDQYTKDMVWSDFVGKFTGTSVSPTTRSIALKDQIQYAVGRLEATIRSKTSSLLDHSGQRINVGDNTFPITGILVGAQRQVGWNFQPKSSTSTQYTMYDQIQGNNLLTKDNTSSNTFSTLVLETPENEKLNIVVELQNKSGNEFRGYNNCVIAKDSKFYLVATLQPNDNTRKKVFEQDFVTKANLTIDENTGDNHEKGLGAAYNVIPDLRTPVLSIGLSVNLEWQSGSTFNVDI